MLRSPVVVQIAIERMKVPERGVGRVVQAFLLAFGKQVGDQAVADIVGERAQDIAASAAGRCAASALRG